MKITDVIVMTHVEGTAVKLPHLQQLAASNPDVTVHIVVGDDSPLGKSDSWKNSDRELRRWWSARRDTVRGRGIMLAEWDTLVSCRLPELPDNLDLAGASCFTEPAIQHPARRMAHPDWTPDNWMWWCEVGRLGLPEGCVGVGLVSFGAYFMRREVLDAISDPAWELAYARAVQNELRFPSIAAASGFRVGELDLPFVRFDDVEVTRRRGIYHSVDRSVPMTFWDDESD